MTNRIAITGPESTGKSALSRQLAEHYQTSWVAEFARDYLNKLDRPYVYDDLLEIAKGQLQNEEEAEMNAGKFLFCDTDLTVLKVWSEYKYGQCDPWILDKFKHHRYDLYLLCDIDLEWQADPLREHPEKRNEIFHIYLDELEKNHFPYAIISGQGSERLKMAIKTIEETFA